MTKKLKLLMILLILVGSTLGGAISSKLLLATPALAGQGDEASNRQQWEYCALSRAAYVNPSREGSWIIYFRDAGPQVVDVQSQATDGNGTSMAKAIARLGAEGWEMVGQGPLDARSGTTNALYFKRQK